MPSERFIKALTDQDTSDVICTLVTIEHADLATPLRYCTGGIDLVQNEGELDERVFEARAMKVALPGEGADAAARRARLQLDNTTQDAVAALRSVGRGRPLVMLEVVLQEFPDDVEMSYVGLQVTSMEPQREAFSLDLAPRDDGEEEWPVQTFSPGRTPGLFN